MRVQRVEASDVLTRDGQTLALFDTELVWLSEIGGVIYHMAVEPIAVADLTATLVSLFGAPPDGSAEASVASLVENLVARGVLTKVADEQHP